MTILYDFIMIARESIDKLIEVFNIRSKNNFKTHILI